MNRLPETNRSYWTESLLVTLVGAFLISALGQEAFKGFFFSEDFITRALLLSNEGNFFKAIFTPFGGFFRPSAVAWSIATQFLLPWDPLYHHVRNFIFDLVALFLVHRILIRTASSIFGRFVGVGFFALSKVHATIIGYINCIDNVGTLLYQLLAILFVLRYVQEKKRQDYILCLIAVALSCFSRDLGCMILLPIFAIVWAPVMASWRNRDLIKKTILTCLPFIAITALYLVIRLSITGLPQFVAEDHPAAAYALRLNLTRFFTVPSTTLGFLLNVLGFGEQMVVGAGDFATLFHTSPTIEIGMRVIFAIVMLGLVVWYGWKGIKRNPNMLFPLLWMLGFVGPLVFVGAFQSYYMYEAVAATAVFLGMIISQREVSRAVKIVIAAGVLLTGVSTYSHNTDLSILVWRWCAIQTRSLNEKIFVGLRGRDFTTLRVVTRDEPSQKFFLYLMDSPPKHPSQVPLLKALIGPQVTTLRVLLENDPEILAHAHDPGVVTFHQDPQQGFVEEKFPDVENK